MALFGKKKATEEPQPFKRDLRKAQRFFEHAQTTADSRQYDYSIECYINGLKLDPDNMSRHEELREVALKRKVTGGKPAGMKEKFGGGKTPIEKLLHEETLWAKDPLNPAQMLKVMERAVEANESHEDDEELNFGEVAYWVGGMLLTGTQLAKKPDAKFYTRVRDLFSKLGAFDKAAEACRIAIQMDPGNEALLNDLRNLEAESRMSGGAFGSGEEGGFRQAVKDVQKQQAMAQEDSVVRSESMQDQMIERFRKGLQEAPSDVDLRLKLVRALTEKEEEASEDEAIKLLEEGYEQRGEYRLKMMIGNIRMKQMGRQQRELRDAIEKKTAGPDAKKEYQQLATRRLKYELEQFTEREKEYPTDLSFKFELGKRLYAFQKFEEAIGMFQQSKADPKYRSVSHEYLGRSYIEREWLEEAIDTLRQGIETHPLKDDKTALELRYLLMDALEKLARKRSSIEHAEEAQKLASFILQNNISFRDIKQRLDQIRQLADELRKKGA